MTAAHFEPLRIRRLLKHDPRPVLLTILSALCGAMAGLGSVWLLSLVNSELNEADGALIGERGVLLAVLCAATFAARAGSDIFANLVGQGIVAQVRLWLARRILGAPLAALEAYRAPRLLPVLTHDVDMISDLAFVAAPLGIALLVMLGSFAWLAWLSPPLSIMVALALAGGGWVQYIARQKGIAGFEASRSAEDELHRAYNAIIGGARELKVNRPRRLRVYHAQIEEPVNRIRAINARAVNTFVVANAFGSSLVFLLIGLVLACRNLFGLTEEALSGFVIALLFLRGPVEQIMGILPTLARAQVALKRIHELTRDFGHIVPDASLERAGQAHKFCTRAPEIRLRNISYSYPTTGEAQPFTLGPLDFSFTPGEITFVIGNNGSGKTTLAKLVLGLYFPQQGMITVDGVEINDELMDEYRQNFSTVLSDFHLFDDLTPHHAMSEEEIAHAINRLGLAGKVTVEDGYLTTTDLSAGQRKRLALLHAWSEARPVLVLDEWAADQDPEFRQVFYEELLPELKAQGKTLIVISHDDRYFHVADRILDLRQPPKPKATP